MLSHGKKTVEAVSVTYNTGEVGVILVNHGAEPFAIVRGSRIAQLVLCRVERLTWIEGALDETARGAAGFGSTGLAGPDVP